MRNLIDIFFSLAFLIATAATAPAISQDQPPGNLGAQDIVIKWRNAVHSEKQQRSQLAVLASDSNQDGIVGRVGDYLLCISRRDEARL